MSKKIGSIILLIFALSVAVIGYRYISYRIENAVSDAAFIKSDDIPILSFKVGGKVVQMTVVENTPVKKGELLAVMDDSDFQTAKAKLEYQRRALEQNIQALELKKSRLKQTLKLQSSISQTDIASLEAKKSALAYRIEAAQAKLAKLQKDKNRYADMLSKNLIAQADFEKIDTETKSALDSIKAMQRELDAVNEGISKATLAHRLTIVNQKQIDEIDKSIKSLQSKLKSMQKGIDELNLKISYTKIYSPIDGIIAKKFFDAPKVISKGSPVYAVADPKKLYCEVLLSEKKLKGVEVGNSVSITVDAIEDKKYKGVVESISPVSASTFSLVPRDIASGEFTKLDQRFTIRIKMKDTEGLRSGMGATVAIKRMLNSY